MHEGVEIPGEHGAHGAHGEHVDNPLVLPVSLTMSIMAVVLAGVTLLAHRANTHELLLQAQATDQWAYFQAKNIRLHEMESVADLFSVLSTKDADKAGELQEKYQKQVEKYQADKEDIGEKAKELEKERDVYGRRADRFEAGEVFLEIALVVCSITLLTNRRPFWLAGILLGATGLLLSATGFLIH
jgi:Domain of unknown function (DUF4337)